MYCQEVELKYGSGNCYYVNSCHYSKISVHDLNQNLYLNLIFSLQRLKINHIIKLQYVRLFSSWVWS
jgi:hypothetical protein